MNKIILFSFLFFSIGSNSIASPSPGVHEFHVSKCQIDYNAKEEALQITLHLFIDDLETALKQQGADKLYICSEREDEKAELYLFRYLQQRFQLLVNETEQAFEFIGKEPSDDLQAVWCYLEITGVSELSSLEITNSLLMEVFADQKNIVQIRLPEGRQSYFMFQEGMTSEKIQF